MKSFARNELTIYRYNSQLSLAAAEGEGNRSREAVKQEQLLGAVTVSNSHSNWEKSRESGEKKET